MRFLIRSEACVFKEDFTDRLHHSLILHERTLVIRAHVTENIIKLELIFFESFIKLEFIFIKLD